ncbi:efflux RND transporter permease subunit [Natrialbaceae archaeon AArc-T1-2]|uniref:efflux RND transporter permease subunit n=1 Tax=Natrialbaceae archaeon AArc-T1-2 TaxID=3053904 RepID=UPI00255B310E|nr:MMPL family transporter [Natrialbaceae archaeon AArc-T1-2]WIV68264.1 MMPL family transporter [Natrialbaceae archaeon AArc-T1-2]
MAGLDERIETATARVNETIVSRPKTVVVAFLLLTAVFAGGMAAVEDDDDATDAFTDDLPEQEAFDAINEEFEGPFTTDDETTQLIHDGTNVLSQAELVAILTVLERVEQRDDLRMESANGPATIVAQQLDPEAETMAEKRRAVERASGTEIRQAIRAASDRPAFTTIVSDDFTEKEASASTSVTVVTHDVPQEFDNDDLVTLQTTVDSIADDEPSAIYAFGGGVVNDEFGAIIGDSLAIVMPIVVVLLLAFLVVAYRDPIDLALGLLALLMTIVWTFGFMGYAGIPFDQQLISVPVLLLAVGVDFGIHIINRYREETVQGYEPIPAMRTATNQLVVAFIIVTVTTVFGFGANVVSDLGPIRNMGIVSSVGIVFTFLIFGLFLPAAKLEVDRLRARYTVPEFNSTPIASEESALGRLLSVSVTVSRRAPVVFVVVLLLLGGGMGAYGAGVDTSFDEEDFLPPEEEAWYVEHIPEPFAPGEYTVTRTITLLEDRFEANQDESVTIYVEGSFEEDHALEALASPNDEPTDSLAVGEGGQADAESIVTAIQAHAQDDEEFAALVARNDRSGNGIPDRNLDRIYDELPAAQTDRFLTDDRRATQLEYAIDAEASQEAVSADAAAFADQFRYSATATGEIVIFDAVSDVIFASAIQGLSIALVLTGVFLVVAYGVLERRPLLGVVNVFPILIAVAALIATMRLLGMPLNALTATILSISIGIGIAYSVHVTARFVDEYDESTPTHHALTTTLSGTGGALTGSMLTTSLGTGALAFAITPVLGDFGLLMALSVFYSFVASVVALPPAIFLWAQVTGSGIGFGTIRERLGG